MEYRDRYTIRSEIDGERFYVTKKDIDYVLACCQLGRYEDIGYSPLELVDILINAELTKDRQDWDLDKLEKWQTLKNIITNPPKHTKESKYRID